MERTHRHTHIHTALRQAGGISLLLIIIMKRLHVEHLPLRAQHDGRSVPPTSLRSHTHSYFSSLSSLPPLLTPPPPCLTIFTRPQGLPADVPLCTSPSTPPASWVSPGFGESQAPAQACTGACFYQSKQMEKEREIASWDGVQSGNGDLAADLLSSSLFYTLTFYL